MTGRFNILIVDDNRELAENLMDILISRDFGSVVAYDGESAHRVAADNEFQLGLIDLKLPDMSGIDLIRKISEMKPEMEFIILTGHGTYEHAAEAVSLKNVLAFETKPVEIDRLLMLVEQVSRRRKLEISLQESEERYKNLLENSLAGINITRDEVILFCNRRMAEIFGFGGAEELHGTHISELIHPDDLEMVKEKINERMEGESAEVRYECRGIRKDGSGIDIEILGTRINYEKTVAMLGTVVDISLRKKAEREIEKYRKNLEEKIAERTEELARKNEELQNFNKLFIGREKRIKELKERIRELEGKD